MEVVTEITMGITIIKTPLGRKDSPIKNTNNTIKQKSVVLINALVPQINQAKTKKVYRDA